MRTRLLAALLPGPQPHRGSPLEDKAPPKEDLCPHQGGSDRGDGSSTGSREYRRRTRFLRSLRLLHPGAAAMKDAVTLLGYVLVGLDVLLVYKPISLFATVGECTLAPWDS